MIEETTLDKVWDRVEQAHKEYRTANGPASSRQLLREKYVKSIEEYRIALKDES